MTTEKKKKSEHYVSNVKFYALMKVYLKECADAEEKNEQLPIIPDPIARKIMLICQRLSFRPNFSGYSYKDEMVSDAIENSILYIRKFKPEKSNNPFSYFTTVAYFSFLRRINKEKKLFLTRVKMVQQAGVISLGLENSTQGHDNTSDYNNSYRDFLRGFYDVDLPEEPEKKPRQKKPRNQNTIDVTETPS